MFIANLNICPTKLLDSYRELASMALVMGFPNVSSCRGGGGGIAERKPHQTDWKTLLYGTYDPARFSNFLFFYTSDG